MLLTQNLRSVMHSTHDICHTHSARGLVREFLLLKSVHICYLECMRWNCLFDPNLSLSSVSLDFILGQSLPLHAGHVVRACQQCFLTFLHWFAAQDSTGNFHHGWKRPGAIYSLHLFHGIVMRHCLCVRRSMKLVWRQFPLSILWYY